MKESQAETETEPSDDEKQNIGKFFYLYNSEGVALKR